jgi:hypothetical protein
MLGPEGQGECQTWSILGGTSGPRISSQYKSYLDHTRIAWQVMGLTAITTVIWDHLE